MYIPEKNKNTNLKRYMYPSVHSSIIYNRQDMEARDKDEEIKTMYTHAMGYYSAMKE